MTFRPALALLVAFVVAAPAFAAQSAADAGGAAKRPQSTLPLKPTVAEAQAAQLSARFLTRFHYDAQPLDDAMSAKIYKAYFKLLDGSKIFFTQQDMARFAKYKDQFDDAIWNENLTAPFDIFNQYVLRAVNRMEYARSLLKKGFDFNTNETFDYDRKHATRPKDMAALDELWRKRTMNDWLRLKLAGKNGAEIRKILDKRYSNYIDRVKQLDSEDAFETFMTAYAHSTDPHTDYFSPSEAQNFDIEMKLSLEGIGAVLRESDDDYTQILELVPGGPAQRSGKIHVGDRIVAVGQGESGPMVDVVGWRLDDVVKLIRGKKNTVVRLEIRPDHLGPDAKHVLVTLVRKKVTIAEQAAKKKVIQITENGVTRKIGVIDLPAFYSDFAARSRGDKNFKSATRDVAKLIGELKAEGVQGIIMDLRNNGGGSLYEANEMTGLFIGKGPVVQVRDSSGRVDVEGSDRPAMAWSGPLVVLVNRGTASASEIFAAAIQDYGRGLIIGTPTWGKGTVQNLVDLDRFAPQGNSNPQYGELKMTIAEFFRVNGGSTQLKGVTPDIEYPQTGDDKDFGESTYDNALPWTHIAPTHYRKLGDMQAWLPQLRAMHAARVAKSPAWQLMLAELAEYKKLAAHTTVSLNYATREAERKRLDAIQASFKARQKAISGNDAALSDEDAVLDDGLTPGERSLKQQLKEQKDAKNAPDPILHETAHILYDAIGLIDDNPKLAAEVEPYAVKATDGGLAVAASAAAPAKASSAPAAAASAAMH